MMIHLKCCGLFVPERVFGTEAGLILVRYLTNQCMHMDDNKFAILDTFWLVKWQAPSDEGARPCEGNS